MGQYLIDSNIISGYFSSLFREKSMNFLTDVIDMTPNISVITEIEALSWTSPDKNKETIVQLFIKDAHILPLSAEVVAQCVKIRRGRKIKTPDAILAATDITYNLTLITGDRGFAKINGLKTIYPEPV